MKKSNLPVISILIGSMAFPIYAEEQQRTYGQPTTTDIERPAANTPAAVQPPASATIQPPVVSPVAVQAASAVPAIPVVSLNKSRLTFMDSKLFDVKLGKELESGKDIVEVDVSGRVPLSNIPARIDRWVVRSAEEGKVELRQFEPEPKTRFIFSLVPMVFSAFGYMKNMQEEKLFDQAKNYDTVIYYKKDDLGDTIIVKIVMNKRKP